MTPFYVYSLPPVAKISVVCYRTGLFCLDKITYLKDIPPELYHSLRDISVEGQNLHFEFIRFSSKLSSLEGSWSKTLGFHPLFLVLAFLVLLFLVVRIFSTLKVKKSVYLLVLPTSTQAVPTVWVRFLFPVLATMVVGYLLVRWRRSGLGFNEFCEEYFFSSWGNLSGSNSFFLAFRLGSPSGWIYSSYYRLGRTLLDVLLLSQLFVSRARTIRVTRSTSVPPRLP